MGQQLSWLSSADQHPSVPGVGSVPLLFVLDHAVEDQKQFPHTRCESHLLRLTPSAESKIEVFDHGVVAAGSSAAM